jgi:heme/copper-type cytochrome/quinol oxidase subunit 2
MTDLGKLLVVVGGVLIAVGLVVMLAGKSNLPLGRLPGDIVYRGKNTVFYFPLATSVVLSIVLTLVLYLVSRFRR